MNLSHIRCAIFDWGGTLSSDLYFRNPPMGTSNWNEILENDIFSASKPIFDNWMIGKISVKDIANILSLKTGLDATALVKTMENGCKGLNVNTAVWKFAEYLKIAGKTTVLVTCNIDLFSSIIVPDLKLNSLFDLIVNSYDYQEIRKDILCRKVFEHLGNKYGYQETIFVEDNSKNVKTFSALGGIVHHYKNDNKLLEWLGTNGISLA
jgi:FMN phosphatase YigB (HAD superfamily)